MSGEVSVSGVWKNAALFLAGVVLSGVVSWSTYVRGAVTVAEARQMIQTESPYIPDREAIAVKLDSIQSELGDIKTAIKDKTVIP